MDDSDYPALCQLCGGYFHQDWDLEFASADEAVKEFIGSADRATKLAIAAELASIADRDENWLAALFGDVLHSYHTPESDGKSHREWVAEVMQSLRQAMD